LAEVVRASNAALRAGLHTSMPGVIKAYDPITKLADVQPVTRAPLSDPETGEADSEDLPVIPNVPVSFPRGGGWHLTFPMAVGDHVTLVFSESETGQWRTTGEVSDPVDHRRHSLGYPTAFPGAHPDLDVLLDDVPANIITYGKLVLGKDVDPTQSIRIGPTGIEIGGLVPIPLALATPTVAALQALVTSVAGLLGAGGPAFEATMAPLLLAVAATIAKGQ
jgi:hypothetical protein